MFNFFKYFNSYENVYFVTTLIVCVGIIISSFEYLVIRKEFKTEGIFSWKIFSSRPNYLVSSFPLKKINFVFEYGGFKVIHLVRIGCCLLLPCINNHIIKALLISLIAISSLLFSYRNIVGNDGSDQMYSIICITLFIAFISNDIIVFKVGLIFIACQSILAYVIAGIAKIFSIKWRNGIAVYQIMNTKTYGHKDVAIYLSTAPKAINYFLCWHIIIFETLFFLVIFLPYPWLLIFIIWGIAFHIYNAISMGLNNFFWAFIATYPAIFFLNQILSP